MNFCRTDIITADDVVYMPKDDEGISKSLRNSKILKPKIRICILHVMKTVQDLI